LSASLSTAVPASAINAKLIGMIQAGAVGLGVLLSGFVIREPAPYEIYMAGLIAVWGLFGLRISKPVVPLLILLVTFNVGGMISMTQMSDLADTPLYLAVSLFLAFSAVFFASVTEAQPSLYKLIFQAWTVSAVVTATLGIAGYFHAFPGAEVFTLYDRAAGAFQDPNVFGPFLVAPATYMLYRLMTGSIARMPLYAVPLLLLVGGIFFSFSRGAWGLFAAAAILLIGALFLQSMSGRFRLRIVVMSVVAVGLLLLAIVVILQIPGVGEFFSSRARLEQDYDSARLGRFARYAIGFQLALEHPLGIGPLVFGTIYGEDTHDIWLKSLMDYGWLGFVSWVSMVCWTIAAGFKLLFRNRPWQPYFLCAYVVFVGHVFLGSIIDTDHWRHFFMLLGMVWGGIALEYRYQRGLLPQAWAARPSRLSPAAARSVGMVAAAGGQTPANPAARLANRSLLGL
jgi:O-antigen ligase